MTLAKDYYKMNPYSILLGLKFQTWGSWHRFYCMSYCLILIPKIQQHKKRRKKIISQGRKKNASRYAPTFLGMRTLSNRVNKEKEINSTMKAGFTLQLLNKKFHNLQTIIPVTHYDLYCTS